jgi:hypothetical protein
MISYMTPRSCSGIVLGIIEDQIPPKENNFFTSDGSIGFFCSELGIGFICCKSIGLYWILLEISLKARRLQIWQDITQFT